MQVDLVDTAFGSTGKIRKKNKKENIKINPQENKRRKNRTEPWTGGGSWDSRSRMRRVAGVGAALRCLAAHLRWTGSSAVQTSTRRGARVKLRGVLDARRLRAVLPGPPPWTAGLDRVDPAGLDRGPGPQAWTAGLDRGPGPRASQTGGGSWADVPSVSTLEKIKRTVRFFLARDAG